MVFMDDIAPWKERQDEINERRPSRPSSHDHCRSSPHRRIRRTPVWVWQPVDYVASGSTRSTTYRAARAPSSSPLGSSSGNSCDAKAVEPSPINSSSPGSSSSASAAIPRVNTDETASLTYSSSSISRVSSFAGPAWQCTDARTACAASSSGGLRLPAPLSAAEEAELSAEHEPAFGLYAALGLFASSPFAAPMESLFSADGPEHMVLYHTSEVLGLEIKLKGGNAAFAKLVKGPNFDRIEQAKREAAYSQVLPCLPGLVAPVASYILPDNAGAVLISPAAGITLTQLLQSPKWQAAHAALEQRLAFFARFGTEMLLCLHENMRAPDGHCLVHNDLKPDNILWDEVTGLFVVCDTGLVCRSSLEDLLPGACATCPDLHRIRPDDLTGLPRMFAGTRGLIAGANSHPDINPVGWMGLQILAADPLEPELQTLQQN